MSAFQAFGAGNGIRTRDLQLGKLIKGSISYNQTAPFSPANCLLMLDNPVIYSQIVAHSQPG